MVQQITHQIRLRSMTSNLHVSVLPAEVWFPRGAGGATAGEAEAGVLCVQPPGQHLLQPRPPALGSQVGGRGHPEQGGRLGGVAAQPGLSAEHLELQIQQIPGYW